MNVGLPRKPVLRNVLPPTKLAHPLPKGAACALGIVVDLEPDQILEPHEAAEFRRFSEGLLRRAIGASHDLSEGDEALAVAGERALADVAGDKD